MYTHTHQKGSYISYFSIAVIKYLNQEQFKEKKWFILTYSWKERVSIIMGMIRQQVQEAVGSHFHFHREARAKGGGIGKEYEYNEVINSHSPLIVTSFFLQGCTSHRFHYFPIQGYQLGSKYSNIQAYGGRFSFIQWQNWKKKIL